MFRRSAITPLAMSGLLILSSGCPSKGDGDAEVVTELTANRAIWIAVGLDSYEYRYRRLCFCPVDAVREVTLRVQDNVVTAGTYIDDGTPVPSSDLSDYPTVDELFDIVQSAIDSGADTVTVEYDSNLGFPTRIALDFSTGSTDDEITHTASGVVATP